MHDEDQQFDLHLWKCDQKINREHIFSNGIHFTKFGNSLAEWSKHIEWTLHGLHPINRPTDQQVQSKISPFFKRGGGGIKIRTFTLKWRSQKILSGHRLVYIQSTDRLTDKCKAICPLFQRGGDKNKNLILVLQVKESKDIEQTFIPAVWPWPWSTWSEHPQESSTL
mgnify:CR=1 FL=1